MFLKVFRILLGVIAVGFAGLFAFVFGSEGLYQTVYCLLISFVLFFQKIKNPNAFILAVIIFLIGIVHISTITEQFNQEQIKKI